MKRSLLKRRQPMRRKADPFETQRAFEKRLFAASAKITAARKPRKPLPKVSARGKARNAEYAKAKAAWLANGGAGDCEMVYVWKDQATSQELVRGPRGSDGCGCGNKPSRSPHHLKRRAGPLLCDIRFFCALCPADHRWVHDNEEEARRLGYLLDRPAKS